MNNGHKFLITGGTGNQGGAIIKTLLKQGCPVKALCRNPQSAAGIALSTLGVQVVAGDLDEPQSYKEHLHDLQGVFSVQALMKNSDQEIRQGVQLADACKEAGVAHLVYASVSGADQKTGIPHFQTKYHIEQHIKNINIPYTIMRPASFCENLLNPHLKGAILKGKLVMPLNKDTVQQYISMHDIGIIGSKILQSPQHFTGKTLTLATDQMTLQQLADLFAEILHRKIKYQKLSTLVTRLTMGKDLAKMFKWMDKNGFAFADDMEALKDMFPGLIDMRTWIRHNFL